MSCRQKVQKLTLRSKLKLYNVMYIEEANALSCSLGGVLYNLIVRHLQCKEITAEGKKSNKFLKSIQSYVGQTYTKFPGPLM